MKNHANPVKIVAIRLAWKLQYIFIDDGYTGTDFSRQGFNEMIKKVK